MEELESKPFFLEKNIKFFFDGIPTPSYVWQEKNKDFVLVYYNKAADKVTNGKIKDLLHKKASEIHEDRLDIIEALNQCFQEKKNIYKKFEYIMKTTGEEVYIFLMMQFLPPNLIIVHINDITRWKLMEKKLMDSEEKYKQLFEHSPESIVLLKLNGSIFDINLATEVQSGYTKDDLLNKNYLKLAAYPSNLIPIFKSIISRLSEGKPIKPIEFEIYKKDGSKAWIRNQISLINFGEEQLIQAFIIDITERKNFEQKIKQKLENEKFISTISSRLIGNIDIDKVISESLLDMGILIGATRAYILLYNEKNSLEFYIQEWCAEGIEPQKIDLTTIDYKSFLWSSKQSKEKNFLYIKDVSELPEEASATKRELEKLKINSLLVFPIKIKNELYGFIGFDNIERVSKWEEEDFYLLQTTSEIISNALERKWSEETLKGSHQLLAGIISSLTDTIFLVDNHLNIIWANNVAKQTFGMQLTGKKCFNVLMHRGKPCKECMALKTFSDGKIHEKEKEYVGIIENKMVCWTTSSAAGLNLEGETELAIVIVRDITVRKLTEDSLMQSEISLKLLNENLILKVEEKTRELKESEENYKRMLNDLDVGFYRGEFKENLLMHNAAFNKILELSESISLVGSKSSQFFVSASDQKNYYRQLLEKGYVRNFSSQIKSPDGKIINVQLNSHLIRDDKGNPKEVEGTIIKLTDNVKN
jgi:PAS domain S-box-containing protein